MKATEALAIIERAARVYGYSVPECAARLRVSESVIYKWRYAVRDGRDPKLHGGIADTVTRLEGRVRRTEERRAQGGTRTRK